MTNFPPTPNAFLSPAPGRAATRGLALAVCAGLALATAASAAPQVGEVASVAGLATAQSPGEEPRALECGDPIFAGDAVATSEGASLGIFSGDFYTGLDESTRMTLSETAGGSPRIDLARGHIRLVDAAAVPPADTSLGSLEGAIPSAPVLVADNGDTGLRLAAANDDDSALDPAGPAPAAIYTPGLVARDAGTDTEAFAFPEKIGVVAMICGWDDALHLTGAGQTTGTVTTEVGGCAIGKPREALYWVPGGLSAIDPLGRVVEQLADLGSEAAMSSASAASAPDPAWPFTGVPRTGRLPINPAMACGAGAPFGVAGHQFLPDVAAADVAALLGPPSLQQVAPAVTPFSGVGYTSCQVGGCAGANAGGGPTPPAGPNVGFPIGPAPGGPNVGFPVGPAPGGP